MIPNLRIDEIEISSNREIGMISLKSILSLMWLLTEKKFKKYSVIFEVKAEIAAP